MEYGYVIDRAWKIIWRYKVLFLFGVISAINMVFGNVYSGFNSYSGAPVDPEALESMKVFGVWGPTYEEFMQKSMDEAFLMQIMGVVFGLMAVGLVIQFVLYAISLFGNMGLIHGTIEAETGTEKLSFGDLFQKSVPFFWRMLGMNLLVWGVTIAIVLVGIFVPIAMGAIGGEETGGAFFLFFFCIFACFFVIAFIIITMMMTQANVALVAEDLGIFQALKRGWQIFWGNLGVFFFLLIAFIVLGILGYIVISIPNFLMMFNVFNNIESFSSPETMFAEIGRFTPWMILMGILNLLLQVFFKTYFQPFWTLTFFQLTGKEDGDGGDEPLVDDDLIVEEAAA